MIRWKKRVLRLPGLPLGLEISTGRAVRGERSSIVDSETPEHFDPDAAEVKHELAGDARPATPAAETDRRGGFSASYYAYLPLLGAVVAAFGVADAEPWWIVLGVAGAVLGAWLTMRALSIGVSWRGLAWVTTECALLGAVLAAVVFLELDGVAMWIPIGVAVFAAPWIATRLTGVREP